MSLCDIYQWELTFPTKTIQRFSAPYGFDCQNPPEEYGALQMIRLVPYGPGMKQHNITYLPTISVDFKQFQGSDVRPVCIRRRLEQGGNELNVIHLIGWRKGPFKSLVGYNPATKEVIKVDEV